MGKQKFFALVRNDECEVKTLSCFRWEELFNWLKYSILMGDFSAYVSYVVLLEFHFVVHCDSEHFKMFSNGNCSVFAIKLRLSLHLSHGVAWYFEVFLFILFPWYH